MKFVIVIVFFSNILFAGDVIIFQKDKAFHTGDENTPAITSIDAKIGDTLYFMNKEKDVTHNVFSLTPEREFEIKSQVPNNKKEDGQIVLDKKKFKPGVMEVECAIHPTMKIKVNIKE